MQDREQRIREQAHLIWLDEGKPWDRADEHWKRASQIIDSEDALSTLAGDPRAAAETMQISGIGASEAPEVSAADLNPGQKKPSRRRQPAPQPH